MKTATFLGKTWRVIFSRRKSEYGKIESPTKKGKRIILPPPHTVTPEEELCTAIHEALHACMWWLDEEYVDDISRCLARFLWRLGYRKEDE